MIGIDNINDYYDVNLKNTRLEQLKSFEQLTFIKGDISDKDMITKTFEEYKQNIVVNLADQAGVRYSIENPDVYILSNIIGFLIFLKLVDVIHLSTSSMSHLVQYMHLIRKFRLKKRNH